MSQRTKKEVLAHFRRKYGRAGRGYKSRILDEFCEMTGHERKHAIKLMNGKAGRRKKPPGRKKTYGPEVSKILKRIWMAAEQPCGKRLHAVVGDWLDSYERAYGSVEPSVRGKLEAISPAQIDRLLAPYRAQVPKRRHTPRPGTQIRQQVPIRKHHEQIGGPGYLEVDTVAHCGGSMRGDFVWSVNFTDVYSGWAALGAAWNCGKHGILEQTRDAEERLPFPMLGFDSDNGGEFMNQFLLEYLTGRKSPVRFTRSRAYRKNDNAHVEQKNYTHVRNLLGYERLNRPELVELINHLYRAYWEPLLNFFLPTQKLISKERIGSRYRKIYDQPKTPYQRLLASGCLSAEAETRLTAMKAQLDPFTLSEGLENQLRKIYKRLEAAA